MAPASGSHADSNAFMKGIQSPTNLATHASQPRYGSQAEACPNGSFPAVQQLAQSTPHSETINAAVTEEHSRKWYRMARSRPIARDQTATHDAKLAVLRVLSEAFEQAAKQFTYAIRTHVAARVGIDLRRVPAAFPVNTGWAIQASDKVTRDMLVQRQSDWALELTDLRGIEINYDVAVREEIVCQTGLEPSVQTALLSDIGF
ncbi:hypothetical protein HRG_014324 [Hirsutella rhossiliensis]